MIAITFHTSIPVTLGICFAQHLCTLQGKPFNEHRQARKGPRLDVFLVLCLVR